MILLPVPPQQGNQDRWPISMFETVTEHMSETITETETKKRAEYLLYSGHGRLSYRACKRMVILYGNDKNKKKP
jgi:hypothetical protein